MTAERERTVWQSMVWHAPGFIVGLYFLSLQFLATINLSYIILLAGAIFLLLAQPVLAWRRLFTVPSALALAILLSTIASIEMADSKGVNALLAIALIPGLLVYLIVVLCVNSAQQLLFLALSFLACLCVVAATFLVASMGSGFSRGPQLIHARAHPLFMAVNDMLMFAIFLPLAAGIARRWPGRSGLTASVVYAVVLTGLAVLMISRLSMLILAACCLAYFGVIRQRRFWYALGAVAAIATVIFLNDASFAHKLQSFDLARLRTWVVATAMFADAPGFGNGPGSFSVLYPAYFQGMPESIRFGQEIRNIGWAHSLFFEAAAERGAIGLAVFVAYFGYLFVAINRKLRAGADDFLRALRVAVVVCLVVALFELSMLRVWGVFTLYLLLALTAVFAARTESVDAIDER